jgi:hypothetical protein
MWKTANHPNARGMYEVSDTGEVRNIKTGRVMKQSTDTKGYPQLELHAGGIGRTTKVHKLVAWAFLGEPPFDKAQVNHIDGNKKNNSVGNLEWVTCRQNIRHSWINRKPLRGEAHGNAKLTEDKVLEMRRLRHEGVSQKEIAATFGVELATITDVVSGRSWVHVGGPLTRGSARRRFTEDELRRILILRRDGRTLLSIATELRRPLGSIARAYKEAKHVCPL